MSGPLNNLQQAPETTHERILAAHAEAEVLRKAIGTLARDLRMDELMDRCAYIPSPPMVLPVISQ
jgi:hypothetical protein